MEKLLAYILKNYSLNHNIEIADFDIGYETSTKNRIRIVNSSNSFFEIRKNSEKPTVVFKEWKGEMIPFLFAENEDKEILSLSDSGVSTINYDIIGSAFYFLSGWQEIVSSEKDMYGRFPFVASIQKRLNIIEKPIVDYYYDILSEAICKAYQKDKIERRFAKEKMITFISHDIDQCTTGWKEAGFHAVKKMRLLGACKIALNRILGKDVWYNFDEILDYNRKRGIHAAFYFLTRKGKNKKYNIMNADYDLKENRFEHIFAKIRQNNCEVGLQGSLDTGLSKAEMKRDKESIGIEVTGNRCHFLLYDIEKLPAILSDSGIKYDNSTCFAEHVGFRHSTCSPFYYFDFEKDSISESIGLPLVIMDRTLSQKKYMNVPQNKCLDSTKAVIKETAKFNGVLSILWHNHHFSDYKFQGWKEVLNEILDFVELQGGCYKSGEEIVNGIN